MYIIVLSIACLVLAVRWKLLSLNLGYLNVHGRTVPPEFEGAIDPARLERIAAYTVENGRIELIEMLVMGALLIAFLFGGGLEYYDRAMSASGSSFIARGATFFLIVLYAEILLDIPFSLYRHFFIENKYGFNTMTLRLWLTDLVKSLVITTVLTGAVITAALAIVLYSPAWWWFWVWLFLLLFGIFVMYISPYVIEPLFFKFEPVKAEGLEEKIRVLMEQAGLRISRVFQVDASRRSKHSNAYFTGIGRVKRIVLFDTLIEQMSQDEILAVLAHEVGHWKKRHVLKGIIVAETIAFAALLAAYLLIDWQGLAGLVHASSLSWYGRLVVLGFIGSMLQFPFTPVFSLLSRKHELEADTFARVLTGRPDALASSLVKLSAENLSNLHPHPLYAWFYYSHPPVVERIRKLRSQK